MWEAGPGRPLIAAAVDAMDAQLRVDPYGVGESRDGNRRILICWPLAISYVVKEADRIVQVNKVWRYDV
jgi:hypothetical protein